MTGKKIPPPLPCMAGGRPSRPVPARLAARGVGLLVMIWTCADPLCMVPGEATSMGGRMHVAWFGEGLG